MRRSRPNLVLIICCFSFWLSSANAASLPLDPSQFPDPNSLITPALANAITKTVGLGTDHRSYEGASPLGNSVGLDFGLSITVAHIPPDFAEALTSAGLNVSTTSVPPLLPVPRLQLSKGLGKSFGVNFSYIGLGAFQIIGGDVKWTVAEPEEGFTTALRLSYTKCKIGFIQTTTTTPQILFGRKLDFAEPYIGFGYQMSTGTITIPLTAYGQSITIKGTGKAAGALAFTGVQFNMGLQLTVEGGYSSGGVSYFGTKIGVNL